MSADGHSERLRFTKMHGAGNDFVVLDLRDGTPPPDAVLAARLADRHFGVGCDQILTIEAPRSEGAVAAYGIWNSDGSAARQCGNGARCVAAWLVRDGTAHGERFIIDSPVTAHAVERVDAETYSVAMGVPQFEPAQIPLAGFAHARDEYALPVHGETVRFGAVSMGNPHAVLEVGRVDAAPVERVGALLQQNAAFPNSVNVGFAQVVDSTHVRLRVFERGVGETLACGSGACAAAAVLMQRGRVERDVRVSLPGGELRIRWPGDAQEVVMSGPAVFVFDGEWN
ncbi:diaminopimelate epimerase [Xanthomonas vesicatoria]|uniref:Diaminopimelate epimerase n=1 Tax=Xanthomonas vesicatoria TaxID=56460 RepID=A0AAJ0IWJ2_9XANT|nr:diaminopimelate epimerase [Xanthomonas vesicatoria]APO96374.1 diaminopimelate epimerase [Xanthomonas vesicatoria]KHM92842.1 diaminopimelate epimerase [Xanthomonas vesicatoria]KHM96810.1 diaminopimelate epimerase [Xanthomonas vesicatoria]MCC8622751.1 diaminopimelate epimerase [Xanthomonas vesicatoria]MCC8693027.1 diaminopimelate epimerase [Xanthomonas vesicatoria]